MQISHGAYVIQISPTQLDTAATIWHAVVVVWQGQSIKHHFTTATFKTREEAEQEGIRRAKDWIDGLAR
jgi:hypothetical protein